MKTDCKYSEECGKPIFQCTEYCTEYVPYRHKCDNKRKCKRCEDDGYGDFLYEQMR